VTFEVDLINGHKTGFFLDHRHNRYALQQMSKDKTVLDVFSYAGGFSVHALVGGASRVVSVDISKQALNLAKHNAIINHSEANHETISGDAFGILQDLANRGETFDRVIIDPPSFAKKASEVEKALVAYDRLARLGAELVAKDGVLILASCSSRVSADEFFELVNHSVTSVNSRLKLYQKTYHDFDHPVTFAEGSYLKCGYWK
jgi:23S rRNA (cytosine1962-C5)-methyltransferase